MKPPSDWPDGRALWACVQRTRSGVLIDVSVVPNASRTELVGMHDGALRVRLAAVPDKGQANEALARWLARELGVQRACVVLKRGAASRRKQVEVEVSVEGVSEWFDRIDVG